MGGRAKNESRVSDSKSRTELRSGAGAKRKAVFLDRDGVIIRQVELLIDQKKVKLIPWAARAIRALNDAGFRVIVVSNQPVVARGIITEAGIRAMNRYIARLLARDGARVDAWYLCPHHPNATLKRYRRVCACRKPAPGMILKGLKRFKIDPKKSFMIGDALIDVAAGKRARVKTILVKTGPGHARLDKELKGVKPDFTVKNLAQAARVITNAN